MLLFVLLTTLAWSTFAIAQVTTSVWLPGAGDTNQSFVGSVIAQNSDTTTLSIAFAPGPARTLGYYTNPPSTVTLQGTSHVAYEVTGTDKAAQNNSPVTISVGCSRAGTTVAATCTMSTMGFQDAISELCAGLTQPPSYCTNMNDLTFDQTVTLDGASQHYFNSFQLVITAGGQKMGGASVAAMTTAMTTATTTPTASASAPSIITSTIVAQTVSGLGTRSTNGNGPAQTSASAVSAGARYGGFGAASTIIMALVLASLHTFLGIYFL